MEHKSQYGDRQTVGAIYRKAQIENCGTPIECGDMSRELMSSLICDLNDTIQSKPHDGREYYICVHESKDLQMPNCIRRRILTSLYRPWPEDDTVVFRVSISQEVFFCWCLDHWTVMDNKLANENLYPIEDIQVIRHWKNFNMEHFGFMKDPMGNWTANPFYKDKKLVERIQSAPKILVV